jgi:hypothetical protein
MFSSRSGWRSRGAAPVCGRPGRRSVRGPRRSAQGDRDVHRVPVGVQQRGDRDPSRHGVCRGAGFEVRDDPHRPGSTATVGGAVTPGPRDPVRLWLPRPSPSTAEGVLQLLLGHRGAAVYVALLRLLVQLVLGRSLRAAVRALPAALGCGLGVTSRGFARGLRLARPRPLLVDRPRGDLLGPSSGLAPVLGALLDVFVLPFPLGT